MKRQLGWVLWAVWGAGMLASGCASTGGGGFDSADAASDSVSETVALFRERIPGTASYFEDAVGFAVFPSIIRGAAGLGGVIGRGVLVEQGTAVGEIRMWQLIHGVAFGGERHREIVFFQDAEALMEFKAGTMEFRGRGGVAAGPVGAASTPAYVEGVAVFSLSRLGLMVDASIAVAKYRVIPIAGADLALDP
jgi:lipid-binding SYLF domain-containing protein